MEGEAAGPEIRTDVADWGFQADRTPLSTIGKRYKRSKWDSFLFYASAWDLQIKPKKQTKLFFSGV